MATKVHGLFDFGEFEKRKIPTQEKFESDNYQFLKDFEQIVIDGFEDLHSKVFTLFKPGEMDGNLPAVAMISFIRKRIISAYPYYCRKATRTRFKLTTRSGEYIYIKKLNDKFRPSNIPTKSSEQILQQCADENDDNPNIFIGYMTDDNFSKIIGIYAVCIDGDVIEWITDISTLSDSENAIEHPIVPTTMPPTLKEGVVQLKQKPNNGS